MNPGSEKPEIIQVNRLNSFVTLGKSLNLSESVFPHLQNGHKGDFPGCPAVKTLSSQCRGHGLGLILGWGTKILHVA